MLGMGTLGVMSDEDGGEKGQSWILPHMLREKGCSNTQVNALFLDMLLTPWKCPLTYIALTIITICLLFPTHHFTNLPYIHTLQNILILTIH